MTSAEIIGVATPVLFGLAGAFLWWPNRRVHPGGTYGSLFRRSVGLIWLVMGANDVVYVLFADPSYLGYLARRPGFNFILLGVAVPLVSVVVACLQLNSSATLRPLKLTAPPNGAK